SIANAPNTLRNLLIFNGQLYVDGATGGPPATDGPATVGTGLPTTTGQTVTPLTGFPTTTDASGRFPSPYQFVFRDANTIYFGDDRSPVNGVDDPLSGIQKYTQSGGTWSLAYSLHIGSSTTEGIRGLVEDPNNPNIFYATTAETSANKLIQIT